TLESRPDGLGRPLGEELLTPTRIYAKDCLALARAGGVRAFAHITGGGLAANLARSLPPGVDAVLDRSSWEVPAVFRVLQERGGVPQAEMDKTFNLGVGMAAIVAADAADAALRLLDARGVPSWRLGDITEGTGTARLA